MSDRSSAITTLVVSAVLAGDTVLAWAQVNLLLSRALVAAMPEQTAEPKISSIQD